MDSNAINVLILSIEPNIIQFVVQQVTFNTHLDHSYTVFHSLIYMIIVIYMIGKRENVQNVLKDTIFHKIDVVLKVLTSIILLKHVILNLKIAVILITIMVIVYNVKMDTISIRINVVKKVKDGMVLIVLLLLETDLYSVHM